MMHTALSAMLSDAITTMSAAFSYAVDKDIHAIQFSFANISAGSSPKEETRAGSLVRAGKATRPCRAGHEEMRTLTCPMLGQPRAVMSSSAREHDHTSQQEACRGTIINSISLLLQARQARLASKQGQLWIRVVGKYVEGNTGTSLLGLGCFEEETIFGSDLSLMVCMLSHSVTQLE